ncbi:hypothetical protein SIN_0761 [Streptococcus infantis SK1302]|uniref:Uncharacterized protein n=1 Tax=Streptococcus infantis SK1302 TaxID=871237 RepID=A0ABP2J4N6_9STRE|nr:hypothetical protein SIN_0761 [Streptococcus infantis SK1302]
MEEFKIVQIKDIQKIPINLVRNFQKKKFKNCHNLLRKTA